MFHARGTHALVGKGVACMSALDDAYDVSRWSEKQAAIVSVKINVIKSVVVRTGQRLVIRQVFLCTACLGHFTPVRPLGAKLFIAKSVCMVKLGLTA